MSSTLTFTPSTRVRGIYRRIWEPGLMRILGVMLQRTGLALLCTGTPADAPAPQTLGTLEAIVVTAEKRAENVQNVPISVSALSADTLTARHIEDFGALAQALPNVGFSADNGASRIAIRGITFNDIIATDAEPRVAYDLDGIYIARPGNIAGTFFDADHVEVLRGPQGTLFGRNAVAGVVSMITRDPTDTAQGYLQGDVGNYNSVDLQGGIGGPIADGISGRIAFQTVDHDGYGRNLTYGIGIDVRARSAGS